MFYWIWSNCRVSFKSSFHNEISKRSLRSQFLILAALLLPSSCFDRLAVADSELGPALEMLSERSSLASEAVQTCVLELRMMNYISFDPNISLDALSDCITSLRKSEGNLSFDGISRVIEKLKSRDRSKQANGLSPWKELRIVEDGQRARNTCTVDGSLFSDAAFNGEREVLYRATSGQADIFAGRSDWYFYRCSDIRRVFRSNSRLSTTDSNVAFQAGSQLIELRVPGKTSTLVDPESGLVLQSEQLLNGEPVLVQAFFDAEPLDMGVVAPKLAMRCKIRDGYVWQFDAFHLDSADFNISVTEADFSVSLPSETTVVKDKSLPGRKTSKLVFASTDALNDSAVFREAVDTGASGTHVSEFVWVAIGVLLIGVGSYVWKSR